MAIPDMTHASASPSPRCDRTSFEEKINIVLNLYTTKIKVKNNSEDVKIYLKKDPQNPGCLLKVVLQK